MLHLHSIFYGQLSQEAESSYRSSKAFVMQAISITPTNLLLSLHHPLMIMHRLSISLNMRASRYCYIIKLEMQ